MAYKSKGGCSPITAKIKKTTKGGMVTQPLLDMGAPVKMKMSSPAKNLNDGDTGKPGENGLGTKTKQGDANVNSMRAIPSDAANFASQYSSQQKAKASKQAKALKAKKDKDTADYNKKLNQYRSNVLSLDSDTKRAASSKNPKEMDVLMRAATRKSKNIQKFEKNLFDYDTKKNPSLTEGYTAKEYALAKAKGTYKSKAKKKETVSTDKKKDTAKKTTTKSSGKKYNTSMKNFGLNTQARRDEYARRGWKQDKTTEVKGKSSTTDKKSSTGNKKVTISNNASVADKATAVDTKSTYTKPNRKTKAGDKKASKANKKQSQADKAREAGNEKKALRKERAAKRKTVKAQRKYSQAANAINPISNRLG